MSCDSLMPFNCREFTVAYLRWLSFRTASTALTPLGDVPVPLNRRIGGESFDVVGAQAVRASAAMHEMSWMLRFFTRCEQRLISLFIASSHHWSGGPTSSIPNLAAAALSA